MPYGSNLCFPWYYGLYLDVLSVSHGHGGQSFSEAAESRVIIDSYSGIGSKDVNATPVLVCVACTQHKGQKESCPFSHSLVTFAVFCHHELLLL